MENCKALVQEYEDKLKAAKEKEKEKEKPPGAPRGRGRPRLNPQSPTAVKIVQKKPVAPPATVVITTPGGCVSISFLFLRKKCNLCFADGRRGRANRKL